MLVSEVSQNKFRNFRDALVRFRPPTLSTQGHTDYVSLVFPPWFYNWRKVTHLGPHVFLVFTSANPFPFRTVSDTFSPRHIGRHASWEARRHVFTFCRGPPFAVFSPGLEITEKKRAKREKRKKLGRGCNFELTYLCFCETDQVKRRNVWRAFGFTTPLI